MLSLYQFITGKIEGHLENLLEKRLRAGKENAQRLPERKGIASHGRPFGKLIWVHGASIGEAQSALILIGKLLEQDTKLHILITTGTVTSAKYLEDKLPNRALHQFYPIDHPKWVTQFLNHWRPDGIIWMESELWPNMLLEVKKRNIPAALLNARLSDKSFRFWRLFKKSAHKLLSTFQMIIAQTPLDKARFEKIGHTNTQSADNIKFSARPLSHNPEDLKRLTVALNHRQSWVFASTHDGEEALACRIHQILKNTHPHLLTILIPRHPQRGPEIETLCHEAGLQTTRRSPQGKVLPTEDDDIYIADTLGELGLFYRLSPIACIGRSFSNDGGGGHNPIEAAQLHTAILHGPHVQFQQDIYDQMHDKEAALQMDSEKDLTETILSLLNNAEEREQMQERAHKFALHKESAIQRIMDILAPMIQKTLEAAP